MEVVWLEIKILFHSNCGGRFTSGEKTVHSHIKKFLLAFVFLLTNSAVHAENSVKSFVAILPDKEMCSGSKGAFFPLPSALSEDEAGNPYLQLLINNEIDKHFSKKCKLNGLLLKGEITEATLPQLQLGLQLLASRRNNSSLGANTLWLDSSGGLITEAMKIGDVIADKNMETIVRLSAHCYSACVLIYAAAKTRSGIGDIGIHRPFASEISTNLLSYPEYLKKYDALTPILKQYFSKYGVSPSLVDAMNVVSSDDIKILNDEELESYGLGFNNIAAKEFDKARTIQLCGQEYYDVHLAFNALINSCRKRFEISSLDAKDEECWSLARQAYPHYSEQFDACKAEKTKK